MASVGWIYEYTPLAEETAAAFQAEAKHMPATNVVLAEEMLREIDAKMDADAAVLPRRSR